MIYYLFVKINNTWFCDGELRATIYEELTDTAMHIIEKQKDKKEWHIVDIVPPEKWKMGNNKGDYIYVTEKEGFFHPD